MTNQSGFIALISVIIISALLLTIVVALNLTGFLGRYNILDSEFKQRSVSLAEACVDTELLNLAYGTTIILPSTVPIASPNPDSCVILSVVGSGPTTIITQASFPSAAPHTITNIKAVVDANGSITSWQECPTPTSSPCP